MENSFSERASINARVHYVADGLGLVGRAESRCTLHSRACEKYAWEISGTCTAYTPLPDRQQVRTGPMLTAYTPLPDRQQVRTGRVVRLLVRHR